MCQRSIKARGIKQNQGCANLLGSYVVGWGGEIWWGLSPVASHKPKRESLCEPGITHSSRLNQGVVEPVAVSSSLEKRAHLTVDRLRASFQGQAFIGLSDGACRMKAETQRASGCA